ncbi:MAG: sugar phosphate isomerase/epimerase [Acidobacteriia bacterium]|nr:sugar phosphate isomerase/epimerase [Terriglobia bacterium]
MKPSRRDFLIVSALAPAAQRLAAASAPALVFPTAPRDRLAVASYPFRASIDTPRNRARNPQATLMDLKEFPALVVQRFRVRNVEILGEHIRSTEPAYLEQLRASVKDAGSRIVDIPTGVGGSLYDSDAARRATAVGNAKKWIDTAVALDCPSVRIHLQGPRGAAPDAGLAAESLGAVSQYGASKNVVVNLENDDATTEDAFFLAKVIDQVNSPWLRALPDFCNSMLKGDEKFNYDAVTAMFRRAYNISHVKDMEVDGGKVFRVDLERTFAIARSSGYKGYFSLEFEGEGDPYVGTQKLIDESLKYLR